MILKRTDDDHQFDFDNNQERGNQSTEIITSSAVCRSIFDFCKVEACMVQEKQTGLHNLLRPCIRDAGIWSENEEMKRKWRDNEQIERNEEMERE